jgi:translation initiation factor IF-1
MFTDEDVGDLSFEARWLFAGLFTQADREGRLEDRPRKLKVEILPYDKINIESLLSELTEARFISRYQVNGKRYIHIRTFWKHQHFNIKEPPSQLPPPPGLTESTVPAPSQHHTGTVSAPVENARKGVRKGREMEGKGKEGSKEGRVDGNSQTDSQPTPTPFSEEYFDNLQAGLESEGINVRLVYEKFKKWVKDHGGDGDELHFIRWLSREFPRKGNGVDDDDRGTSAQAARVAAMLERDN